MAARRASTGALGSGSAGTSVTIVARPPLGTMPASGSPESGKRTASRTAAPTSVIACGAGLRGHEHDRVVGAVDDERAGCRRAAGRAQAHTRLGT